ncbi:MAG TPA: endonuclease III [Planctomycetota bacterium]|nr:endonuclease III [Planctomycetota bacterium]
MDLKTRARKIFGILRQTHPDARVMLNHRNAYELLVATILAAQCTDERVNEVTDGLFRKYPTPEALAKAKPATLEKEVRPTGFFRQKAKSITSCSRVIVERHGGKVPGTMDELVALPGVGRKTANVVLGEYYDTPGIIVDTHVKRVTTRLGLTGNSDPDRIEADLDRLIPRRDRTVFSHVIGFHGRRICAARKPECDECPVSRLCDYYRQLTGKDAQRG